MTFHGVHHFCLLALYGNKKKHIPPTWQNKETKMGICSPFPGGLRDETKVRNHQTTIGAASTITQTVWSLGSFLFFR